MNDTAELPPPIQPAQAPGMLLHCGGEHVTQDEFFAVPTPEPTNSWFPLAHRDLVTEVRSQLTGAGLLIDSSVHALSHDGARYFGILQFALVRSVALPEDVRQPDELSENQIAKVFE